MMGVEYAMTMQQYYDGISEYRCTVCGKRMGRWTGKELKKGFYEFPHGELQWITYDGNSIYLSEIEDMHLANIILHLKNRKDKKYIKYFRQEAVDRGLTKKFLDEAPFPHKNELGEWILWNYKTNKPVVVGRKSNEQ
jgi:hypothetical protein